jgi:uncharacterized small protein (DUF1192 family)
MDPAVVIALTTAIAAGAAAHFAAFRQQGLRITALEAAAATAAKAHLECVEQNSELKVRISMLEAEVQRLKNGKDRTQEGFRQ